MKILVTGSNGFVGKNLIAQLYNIKLGKVKIEDFNSDIIIYEYDKESSLEELDLYCKNADFVFNLAGVNRPKDIKDFKEGNFGFTSLLLDTLSKHNNKCPVMMSSSIQALLDNPYGESKKMGENLLFDYGKKTGAKVLVYRFPNIFGKWCKPNYNSVIATFCNNIASNKDIIVNDPTVKLHLVYIDDVVNELISGLFGKENYKSNFCEVKTVYTKTLGEIVELLYSFKKNRISLSLPDVSDIFINKLYATYLSYLPIDEFNYPLKMNIDDRGSFTEILRTKNCGQFSVNISKPNIVKGQHWHHTKNEKFVVVSGNGVIRFRNMNDLSSQIIEYYVDGNKIEVIDIPVGYTHNIENLGSTDLVTFMWCNECFNPEKPDTFFESV